MTGAQACLWKSPPLLFFFFNLFIFGCVESFVSVQGLSLVAANGGHSSSRCAGLSLSRPLLLRSTGLQTHRLSSCGARAQLLRGMWDPPRPGLEPVSPALAGRSSTTVPLGKPPFPFLTPITLPFHELQSTPHCLSHLTLNYKHPGNPA